MSETVLVRDALATDLPPMAAMAAALVRFHHELDPARFFLARGVEQGYLGWFQQERTNPDAVLLAAVEGERCVGYLYGRFEARDWNLLLDAHAALHDIFVLPEARRAHVGERLVETFVARVEARGVPRTVLHTAVQNDRAQALFRKMGFRPTMLEMTRG